MNTFQDLLLHLRGTMTRVAALLPLILSLLLSCARASILCSWTRVLPNHTVHVSFVRSEPAQGRASVRLYHASWSGRSALLGCTWTDDAALVRSYVSACRERALEFSSPPRGNISLRSVFEAGQCAPLAAPGRRHVRSAGGQGHQRSEVRVHGRVKRGFIVPGTLWCGSGNKAPSSADLGIFSGTDSCCREHDQCEHIILSFHSQFGVFNSNIFTMSHCDCDNKFRSCLREANDTISDVVGYTFFNLLKMNCFTFSHQLQCTQRNWFGMCKKSQLALYADVHPPTLYEPTQPADACVNSSCSDVNSTAPTRLPEISASEPALLFTTAATWTASVATTRSPSTPAAPGRPTAPAGSDELDNVLAAKRRVVTEPYSNTTGDQMSCDVYKELDECRSRILPHQRKYGFHNTEPRTLYHCNCTAGLFQTLAKQRQLTQVQVLVLGRVSRSCFQPQDCTTDSSCSVVVVKAELPQPDHRSSAHMEDWLHLQVGLKRVKSNHRRVPLSKLCRRTTRAKRPRKGGKQGRKLLRQQL